METAQYHFPEDVSTKVFLTKFREINEDYAIHGILLLQPLPKHIPMKRVAEIMNSFKDIDGMKASNLGKVLTNDPDRLEPCTPAAVMNMLDYYEVDLKGKNVTVVGASAVVGKPLSLLMMNRKQR